ncbi:MAG: sugar transferase, partial [Lachnospiraceae bacterium]|nr:sugar transferase [Lachnospiraceae bacterium]
GLAQVSGRNFLEWDKRLEKDAEYVENLSFGLDIKIFFTTIKKVFVREDVVVDTNKVEGNLAEIRKAERECN